MYFQKEVFPGGDYLAKVLLGMCRWSLSLILWPIIGPFLVTFEQMCNFLDLNLLTFNCYLFICSTNILVRLLIVNMKNCLTPQNPKMCDPLIVDPIIKMRPHYSQ